MLAFQTTKIVSLSFILFFCLSNLQAQEAIFIIKDAKQRGNLDTLLYVAEVSKDAPKNLDFAQKLSFKPFEISKNTFPTDKNYWTKIHLYNALDQDVHFVLNVGEASLVTHYILKNKNLVATQKAGTLRKLSERTIKQGAYDYSNRYLHASDLYIGAGDTLTLYSCLEYSYPDMYYYIYLGSMLSPYEDVMQSFIKNNIWQAFFQGAIWIILIYHLFITLFLRQKEYWFYIGYMFFTSLFYGDYNGFWRYYLYGEYPQTSIFVNSLAYQVAVTFYLMFMQRFLNMRQDFSEWNKVINVWIWFRIAYTLLILVAVLGSWEYSLVTILIESPFFIEIVLILLTLLVTNWRKNILARYFAIGTILYNIGFGLFMAQSYLIEPLPFPSGLDVQVGILLELICFSLGLGYKARRNELEKKEAQKKLIEQLKANEKLQKEYTHNLEKQVKERTLELSEANEELRILNEQNQITLEQLKSQKLLIEEKNKSITDSINYAQNIQNALLPFTNRFDEELGAENYFVFYQPKDIVSGDFYWYQAIRNKQGELEKYIFVVADCTGHGVPGAFMSILGINFLEEIIQIKQVHNPEKILEELDKMIIYALKQEQTQRKDGMCVGICVVDVQKQEVSFAGAAHSLYVFHKASKVLEEIPANPQSVGGTKFLENFSFIKCSFPFPPDGLTFYMASDGFQDQFGEKTQKKLMRKGFKAILERNAHEKMQRQFIILKKEFDLWKGQEEQIDDVLVMGVSIGKLPK
jgi:serine phosphatase RsbU (regulator of sigma subunit)